MQQATISGTSLVLSRFSFGTASLHHLRDVSDQVSLLQTAVDYGFTHFDTSPLYGFGWAERALGTAFRGPDYMGLTFATKVGLYPPGGTEQSRLTVLARKALGRMVPSISRAVADWHVSRAKASLSKSLERLGREHIDLLLLHEPHNAIINTDEWMRWLEDETANRIVAFGISGTSEQVSPFIVGKSPIAQVVQMHDSITNKEADLLTNAGRKLQLTYGYISSAPPGTEANTILSAALTRNKNGSVVVSTRNPERLSTFASLAHSEEDQSARQKC